MLLVIDNYDSFTYNLVQYLYMLDVETVLFQNDTIGLEEIEQLSPDYILLSPGPGNPYQSGITLDVIQAFKGRIPIMGVCLGMQAIAVAFGGKVIRLPAPTHGKVTPIDHDGKTIYQGLPSPFQVTRYHSLAVCKESLPDCLEISATTADGIIMGLRHKEYAVEGVQFHPEAILTEHGLDLLRQFLTLGGRKTVGN